MGNARVLLRHLVCVRVPTRPNTPLPALRRKEAMHTPGEKLWCAPAQAQLWGQGTTVLPGKGVQICLQSVFSGLGLSPFHRKAEAFLIL